MTAARLGGWWARRLVAGEPRPLARLARAPLSLLAAPYAAGARLHRLAYEARWLERARLPCSVLVVGSPLVGVHMPPCDDAPEILGVDPRVWSI